MITCQETIKKSHEEDSVQRLCRHICPSHVIKEEKEYQFRGSSITPLTSSQCESSKTKHFACYIADLVMPKTLSNFANV